MTGETRAERENVGRFDARYKAFLQTTTELRPRLHRYCSRMTGSVLYGEDLVQEALFQAYRKLDTFDDGRPFKPWLFRIAHNVCIDFLRGGGRELSMAEVPEPDPVGPDEPTGPAVRKAIQHLVLTLPPKERACVLLKDVFDYSLEEIAALVDSTVGGVKAALKRARTKLAAGPVPPPRREPASADKVRLLHLYVERFNRKDWDGVRELTSADARLLFADGYAGRLADAPYFTEYARSPVEWRMVVGEIDGEAVIISQRRDADEWRAHSAIRVELAEGRIVRISDYLFCDWILPAAESVVIMPA
jgi:RNA polymerase sigma-70 factor (ECF subfamily)